LFPIGLAGRLGNVHFHGAMGTPRILLFLLAAALAATPALAVDLQRLVANSPFAPAGTPGQPGSAQPLEFRGVFMDQGEHFFSVFNPATKQSVWVGLNEASQEFFIRSYDEDAQSIVADYKGRSLTLSLSKAPTVAAAQAVPVPPTVAGAVTPTPAAAAASSSTEAKRLADLAAEIRRRRALRQQTVPPPGIAAPAPPSRQP